jgi:peptidoglycan/xylan/chitin deacetylase (PgdA/CDA1 family)
VPILGRKRVFLGVLACFLGALVAPAVASAGPTVVSLTFDDGTADQYQARSILAQNGVHGTFYVNSNHIGGSFMTWEQLTDLASDGNEIAGHTLDHVDLTTVSSTEATRQVCDDRQALISHGFNVTDFAYPYGGRNTSVESIVRTCGYSSGRHAWGLCPIGQLVPNCPDGVGGQQAYASSVPPPIVWRILSAGVRAYHTVADLEQAVTRAESSGGGWVPLMIHHVCDGCDPTNGASVSPATLNAFLAWLAGRSANGTYVRTMSDVVSDRTAPSSSIACNGTACSSAWYAGSVNVSLSAVDTGTAVSAVRYTTDGSDPTTSSTLYTGPFTVSATKTVKFRAWDMAGNVEATKSQLIQVDTTLPVSAIACDGAACSSGWYAASVDVSLSATDTGSGVSAIRYTTDGSNPTASSTLYSGSFSVSSTSTVKYRAWDSAGNAEATKSQLIQVDTTGPVSTIACNDVACSSTPYTSPVTVSLAATDADSGVAALRYTVDGSDPTTSSALYVGSFAVSDTTTVKYRAWDAAGNVEATNTQLILFVAPDTTPPVSTIACDGAACSSGWYGAAVDVSLSATDAESGVSEIRYTTDGSDPTTSSTLYVSPFTVSATTTVKYRAWDAAGNVETTNSQLIQIDTTTPASTIACNGAACSSSPYTSPVSVSLSATDGASGVASIRYTTDGSTPTTGSTLYSGPFTVSATTTVNYRAWDVAGNAEATNTQFIQFAAPDTTPPVTAIACNGVACSSAWYAGSVNVSLSATDGGSGVAAIRYTTDGSDPTTSSTSYTGPFSVSVTTTVKFRAWDVAGNVESTKSQQIRIDRNAPLVAITSPANGATVTGNIKIIASPSDAETGVASVKFYVDGVLVGTVTGSPWQIAWNTKKYSSGQHVLTAVATDRAGNTRTSAPVTVTVR